MNSRLRQGVPGGVCAAFSSGSRIESTSVASSDQQHQKNTNYELPFQCWFGGYLVATTAVTALPLLSADAGEQTGFPVWQWAGALALPTHKDSSMLPSGDSGQPEAVSTQGRSLRSSTSVASKGLCTQLLST